MRASRLWVSLVALAMALPAAAQDLEFPDGNVIPNYNRMSIGQREGLEAGAFVARTDDAAANWYNPAGLARSEKVALNASGNAYEYTTVALAGLGTKRGGARFSSLGTFFGVVVGDPILKNRAIRLGLSFTKPVAWNPSAVDGSLQIPVAGGSEQIGIYSENSLSVFIPRLSAGLMVTPGLRLGAGLGVPITSLNLTAQLTDRFLHDDGNVETRSNSLVTSGTSTALELTGGAQLDVGSTVTLGALVTLPSARLGGSARVSYQGLGSLASGGTDVSVRDPVSTFDYQHPLRVVAGASVQLGRFTVEANVRLNGSRPTHALVSSDSTAQVITYPPGGTATITQVDLQDVTQEIAAATGVTIGANYTLSETFKLHAGFFTDPSQVGTGSTAVFRVVDLTGFTGGLSFGGRLSGSVGVGTTWGTTEERTIGPSLGGEVTTTTVETRTYTFLYSISYQF